LSWPFYLQGAYLAKCKKQLQVFGQHSSFFKMVFVLTLVLLKCIYSVIPIHLYTVFHTWRRDHVNLNVQPDLFHKQ